MTKIADLLSSAGVDMGAARATVINWPNQVVAIVDGYRSYRGVAHGVQKDAIQNSWDARKDRRRGTGWGVVFELVTTSSGELLLTITDKGTTGLTGRVLKPTELQDDLPAEERWGRFENVAFTKDPSEGALGSRGRGKFIFVGASKQSTIMYDTLRDDGVYRAGLRTVKLTESPIWAWEMEDARVKLRQLTEDALAPLGETGTRIVIFDPIEELVEAIRGGQFLRNIEETWWEILLKYGVKISVVHGGNTQIAKVPEEFVLPDNDSRAFKVWIKEPDKAVIQAGGVSYRIKRLHIVCNMKEQVPEDLRGVAIQRGGMKITSVGMRYVPAELANSVYGYVTLDRKLEEAILPHENPEHYGFDYRSAVPRALRNYVQDQLDAFAREKLGVGDPAKVKHERQKNAEQRALNAVNRIARTLGLVGAGPGRGGGNGGVATPKKGLRIELGHLTLPRPSRRVNYGETVRGICATVVNETDVAVPAKVLLSIQYGGSEVERLVEWDGTIEAGSRWMSRQFEHTVAKSAAKGRYLVQALLISLRSEDKGRQVDQASAAFWVEQDPPERGIFDKVVAEAYPDEMSDLGGYARASESGGYTFTYNVDHPAYEDASVTEDALTDYLVTLMALEVSRIDLLRPDHKLYQEADMETPDRVVSRSCHVYGRILRQYYSS